MRGILAFGAASIACAVGAFAQAPIAPALDPALPPRYEVEVIVFAYRDLDPTEERFQHAPKGFASDSAATLQEAPVFGDTASDTALTPPPVDALPPPPVDPVAAARAEALSVRLLAPEELDLNAEYRRIQAISAYVPLVHVGWVQPSLPEEEAVPFELKTLGILNPLGNVRVHLSRFNRLHVTLDLTYQASSASAQTSAANDGLDEIALAPQYHLTASRSVRSTELHYFDHPAFGVLVRITPVPVQDGTSRRPAA
jgi:hypothetical protein